MQILISGLGIAQMKLHRLADAHQIAHRDHARVGVGPKHIPHQEVAAAEGIAVFARRPADVER